MGRAQTDEWPTCTDGIFALEGEVDDAGTSNDVAPASRAGSEVDRLLAAYLDDSDVAARPSPSVPYAIAAPARRPASSMAMTARADLRLYIADGSESCILARLAIARIVADYDPRDVRLVFWNLSYRPPPVDDHIITLPTLVVRGARAALPFYMRGEIDAPLLRRLFDGRGVRRQRRT